MYKKYMYLGKNRQKNVSKNCHIWWTNKNEVLVRINCVKLHRLDNVPLFLGQHLYLSVGVDCTECCLCFWRRYRTCCLCGVRLFVLSDTERRSSRRFQFRACSVSWISLTCFLAFRDGLGFCEAFLHWTDFLPHFLLRFGNCFLLFLCVSARQVFLASSLVFCLSSALSIFLLIFLSGVQSLGVGFDSSTCPSVAGCCCR